MIVLCLTGSIVAGHNRQSIVKYDELYALNENDQTDEIVVQPRHVGEAGVFGD